MTIGERIKEARKSKGLTQEDLAKLLGVTFAMIGQYERGERNPKMETLQKIALALDVTVASLQGKNFSILDMTTPSINFVKITQLSQEYRANIERVIKITEGMPSDVLQSFVDMLDGTTNDEIDKIISYGMYLRGIPIPTPNHSSFSLAKEKPDGDAE